MACKVSGKKTQVGVKRCKLLLFCKMLVWANAHEWCQTKQWKHSPRLKPLNSCMDGRLPSFGHNLVQSESVKRCPVHREKTIQNVADISTGFWSILNGVQGSTFTRVYSWPLNLSCVYNLLLRYPTLLTENHKFTSIRPGTTRIHLGKQTKSKTKKFGRKKRTQSNLEDAAAE